MPALLTKNRTALRYLMTEELYSIAEPDFNNIEETTAIEPIAEEAIAFDYLGENNRYMLILVKDVNNKFISDQHLDMLIKILKGKQMELRDVAIMNLARQKAALFEDFKNYFACKNLVMFGIDPKEIGLSQLAGNAINSIDGVNVLATFNFAEMQDNDEKKRTFWQEMKKLS